MLATAVVSAAQRATTRRVRLFDVDRPHTVHLRMSAKAWQTIQPTHGAYVPPAPSTRPNRPKAPAVEGRRLAPGPSGNEYAYVRAAVEFDGRRYEDVGVRLKGNVSYAIAAGTPRLPYKLDFDRFLRGRRIGGEISLNLNNNSFDPTQCREPLAYWVFRRAGVPAPRTASALFSVTIDGAYSNEYLGLYTLVEEVDERFLKRHFKSGKGLLLKPEGVRGLPYLGDNWDSYTSRFRPRSDVDPNLARRFIEFLKLVNQADDQTFRSQIESYLAVDEFLRFVAVNAAIANLDSFLCTGHNYYLYVDPVDGRTHWIPWDMHLSFSGYTWVGSGRDQVNLSISHPWWAFNRLIERLLSIPQYQQRYRASVERIWQRAFKERGLEKRLRRLEPILETAAAAAARAGRANSPTTRPAAGLFSPPPPLSEFIARRGESIANQLQGKGTAYIPVFNRPEMLPPAHAAAAPLANALWPLVDVNRDGRITPEELAAGIRTFFAAADQQKRGALDEHTLTHALAQSFAVIPAVRHGAPAAWAKAILACADLNGDGRLTLDELIVASRRLLGEVDRDVSGFFDEREFIEAIIRLLPQ